MTISSVFYFISDLHIGGDEALGVCEFEEELAGFLRDIAARDEDAELIIVGDAFGLWEFTDVEGLDKLRKLIGQFPVIFEAFRTAGERITITLLPGNHDYEIACYPEFEAELAAYNVKLARTVAVTRRVGERSIWIEHGNQHDAFNRMPDFGNPHAQPIGYFVTSNMVSAAGKRSEQGRYNWLKDIQSVYPTEQVPYWVFSNYFYREMSPFLRWLMLPFLLLFGITLITGAGAALEYLGLTDTNLFLDNRLFASMGYFGSAIQLILTINLSVMSIAALVAIPLFLLGKDVERTLRRFHVIGGEEDLAAVKEDDYVDAAKAVFEREPETVLYVYGHTHKPSVRHLGGRAIVNTGTWLKRLEKVPVRFGLLPPIFVASFNLAYFRVSADGDEIVIDYHRIPKETPPELSVVQRLLVSRSVRQMEEPVPARTVLEA